MLTPDKEGNKSENVSLADGFEMQVENTDKGDPFRRRDSIRRTPPRERPGLSRKVAAEEGITKTEGADATHKTSQRKASLVDSVVSDLDSGGESPEEEATERGGEATSLRQSPKGDFISKMREDEEEELAKCRSIIARMKTATSRQKNVSMDIKNGLAELEEVIDIISSYRRSWKKAEAELQKLSARQEAPPLLCENAKKRIASSPAAQSESKKKKGEEATGEWTIATSRRVRRRKKGEAGETATPRGPLSGTVVAPAGPTKPAQKKRRARPRNDALLIRPAQGKTYADILREIRQNVKPEETETVIKSIRQTKMGGVLLELGKETKDKRAFCETVKVVLGEKGSVSNLEPKRTLEIVDLDCLTDEREVEASLRRDFPDLREVKISLTRTNAREQKIAIIEVDEAVAAELLKQTKIKIGWVNCRVRNRVLVRRCYRCLGYGHIAVLCKGPDRSNLCYKCGHPGHKGKTCTTQEQCVLCKERGLDQGDIIHVSGSGKCRVFREALESTKQARRRL